jgi:hypothetical protein
MQSEATSASVRAPADAPAAALRRHVRGAALWATIGFVAGAVFWHAIGFWTFVSDIVFDSTQPAATEEMASAPLPADTSDIVTGSLPTILRVDPSRCTSLELDRSSNRTSQRPCPADGIALRLEQGSERGDLALLADAEAFPSD